MFKKLNLVVSIMAAALLFGCSNGNSTSDQTNKKRKQLQKEKVELTMSAAASLQNALTDIEKTYEKKITLTLI
ncbi:hypothetical protein GCM10020331_023890 [Ectobacillus funiculus]